MEDNNIVVEEKKRVCKICKKEKDINEFSIGQYGKNNRPLWRPSCKKCLRESRNVNEEERKVFILNNPRPSLGEKFKCPICEDEFVRKFFNDVSLDHNNKTGHIRGWLCNNCNTSLGKFKDNEVVLLRAIEWIKIGALE